MSEEDLERISRPRAAESTCWRRRGQGSREQAGCRGQDQGTGEQTGWRRCKPRERVMGSKWT